jgi:hypothetical protein
VENLAEAERKKSQKMAKARGDSDEVLSFVCKCGGRTKGVLTAKLTCPSCGYKNRGHSDNWSMSDGSEKPKAKIRQYQCIESGTMKEGRHGQCAWCCGMSRKLGGQHFKALSQKEIEDFEADKRQAAAEKAAKQYALVGQKVPTANEISVPPLKSSGSISPNDGSTPTDADVLFGPGGRIQNHPGNVRLREIVDDYMYAYKAAKKPDKKRYSEAIVQALKEHSISSRFLRKNEANQWEDVDDKCAVKKVSKMFWDATTEISPSTNEMKRMM